MPSEEYFSFCIYKRKQPENLWTKEKDFHARSFTVKRLVIKKLGYQGVAITYDPFLSLLSLDFQHCRYSGFHVFSELIGPRGFVRPDAGVGNFEGYFLFMWRVWGRGKNTFCRSEGRRSESRNRMYVLLSCETFNFKIPSGSGLYMYSSAFPSRFLGLRWEFWWINNHARWQTEGRITLL